MSEVENEMGRVMDEYERFWEGAGMEYEEDFIEPLFICTSCGVGEPIYGWDYCLECAVRDTRGEWERVMIGALVADQGEREEMLKEKDELWKQLEELEERLWKRDEQAGVMDRVKGWW